VATGLKRQPERFKECSSHPLVKRLKILLKEGGPAVMKRFSKGGVNEAPEWGGEGDIGAVLHKAVALIGSNVELHGRVWGFRV
jgi:hypothetical protein